MTTAAPYLPAFGRCGVVDLVLAIAGVPVFALVLAFAFGVTT
jgi:hypothetical protein